jgi:isochorismate hydrolase
MSSSPKHAPVGYLFYPPREQLLYQSLTLMVIDMQTQFIGPPPYPHCTTALIKAQRQLIERCQAKKIPYLSVVYQLTQHPGRPIDELELLPAPTERYEKSVDNAMRQQALAERLGGLQRPTIIMIGVNSHVCVARSAKTALDEAYNVIIPEDTTAIYCDIGEVLAKDQTTGRSIHAQYSGAMLADLIDEDGDYPDKLSCQVGTAAELWGAIEAANLGEKAYQEYLRQIGAQVFSQPKVEAA